MRARGATAKPRHCCSRPCRSAARLSAKGTPDTLIILNNLAGLSESQGRYGEAEALLQQALQLSHETFGETHPDTLVVLNNLAGLYESQGRYDKAQPLYKRALQIHLEVLGPEGEGVTTALNNLASLYLTQGRLGEAEPLYKRALKISPRIRGAHHPIYSTVLNNLAHLYRVEGNYNAEKLYQRELQERLVSTSRLFAGPTQYPPQDFTAYGLLAFRSRASSQDRLRHLMICEAYVTSLPHASELDVPRAEQMVTVWPTDSDSDADQLNLMARNGICNVAVDNYGLVTALQALKDAEFADIDTLDRGPFLLAWSPSVNKGKKDTLVLVSNLSGVTTFEQAQGILLRWSRDIEQNPELWRDGWNLEQLRMTIRLWVDEYGPKILTLFGGKG